MADKVLIWPWQDWHIRRILVRIAWQKRLWRALWVILTTTAYERGGPHHENVLKFRG